jgi:hypothetical protein
MVTAAKAEASSSSFPAPESGSAIDTKYIDVTLAILENHGDEVDSLTAEKEKKLRRKLYWNVIGLLSAINLLLFVGSVNK